MLQQKRTSSPEWTNVISWKPRVTKIFKGHRSVLLFFSCSFHDKDPFTQTNQKKSKGGGHTGVLKEIGFIRVFIRSETTFVASRDKSDAELLQVAQNSAQDAPGKSELFVLLYWYRICDILCVLKDINLLWQILCILYYEYHCPPVKINFLRIRLIDLVRWLVEAHK